jgi:hypothetical protein
MIIIVLSLSLENFLAKLHENPKLKFFENYISSINFSKWEFINASKFMIEYNAMFENGFLSFGYEISPSIIYDFHLNKANADLKIYEVVKQKNEFIFQAVSTYIKALIIKNEVENKEKIISNYKKIAEILENEHKFKIEHPINEIILIKSEISNLESEINILKEQYKSLLAELNAYVEIDSVEEINEIPKIQNLNVKMTIDFKILEKNKQFYNDNLKLSYLQVFPSIKPSILRRNDGTYAFMIGFAFSIFPLSSIKQNKILVSSFNEKFLNYYENYINSKILQIITDYENAKKRYENYEKLRKDYEKTLKTLKNDYKFSNFDLIDYYKLENKLFEIEIELKKSKYETILKSFELNKYIINIH